MRISDWSSDVCSSDLNANTTLTATPVHALWMSSKELAVCAGVVTRYYLGDSVVHTATYNRSWECKAAHADTPDDPKDKGKKKNSAREENGREPCREKVWQYV